MTEYKFKTVPFTHQAVEFEKSKDLDSRAIFWEQGTGKTKITIDQIAYRYLKGDINAVLIVAPNGVHRNWVEDEIITHLPDDILNQSRAHFYQSLKASTKWHKKALQQLIHHPGLVWLAISYEAFITTNGKEALYDLFQFREVFYVLDESHYVKEPKAERTKSILKSAKYAKIKRILSGTPIALGPFDVYPQIQFVFPDFWQQKGFSTFASFKNYFGVWKKGWNPRGFNRKTKQNTGAEFDQLVSYRRLDDLKELLSTISSRVTKEDAKLDIPPKRYETRFVELTPAQRAMYDQMKEDYVVWFQDKDTQENLVQEVCSTCGGEREIIQEGFIYSCPDCAETDPNNAVGVFAELALVRLLRLQQITCGYLPVQEFEEPYHKIDGGSPKIDELIRVYQDNPKKTIVWARFTEDISQILQAFKAIGVKAVRYDGQTSDEERAEAKALFQGTRAIKDGTQVVGREDVPPEEQAQVFVGNPSAGATGLTLTAAKQVVYYSNNFKLIDRLQSEDRAHRIGQSDEVIYIDIIARDTVDEKIVATLKSKLGISSQILGDKLKEWL